VPAEVRLLFVCTANQARSPMAAAIARRELALRGVDARVDSGGTDADIGLPALAPAVAVMQAEGIDLSEHRSRPVEPRDLERADLIVTMTRAHLRHVATLEPAAFPRLFALKELADQARTQDARAQETVFEWIDHLSRGRRTADLLGDDPLHDVHDPAGCDVGVYVTLVRELSAAISNVIDAGWPLVSRPHAS
jgi:protein-tyrosine-phosphatase